MRDYRSESDKVRDLPQVMQYVQGKILDIGCGTDKIFDHAFGIDGRDLPGVDKVVNNLETMSRYNMWPDPEPIPWNFDTVYSSHTLEHMKDQWGAVDTWGKRVKTGGHLIFYLPDGDHYDNKENPEHMVDMKYDSFMFWFKRAFCGEGKDFKGNNLPKVFELIDSGMDVRKDCYSFYIIAKKV